MSYKSTHTGAQIDAGVSAALNPDTTVTPSGTNLVTSGAVDTAIKNATTNEPIIIPSTATAYEAFTAASLGYNNDAPVFVKRTTADSVEYFRLIERATSGSTLRFRFGRISHESNAELRYIAVKSTYNSSSHQYSYAWEDVTTQDLQLELTFDNVPTDGSSNPVKSNGIYDALALKAPLDSPTLTGTPTAPTQSEDDNSTKLATTEYVDRMGAQKAEVDGSYDGMTVGNAEQLVSTVMTEDKAPYVFRTSGGSADIGNREYDTLVGGTVAWNQQYSIANATVAPAFSSIVTKDTDKITITADNKTIPTVNDLVSYSFAMASGHKYLVCGAPSNASTETVWLREWKNGIDETGNGVIINGTFNGTDYIYIRAKISAVLTGTWVFRPQLIDLTQTFGTTIADYIYSLETANAGADVAWFRKLFPKLYYAYNAGTLIHVNASAHKTVGFNQFDFDGFCEKYSIDKANASGVTLNYKNLWVNDCGYTGRVCVYRKGAVKSSGTGSIVISFFYTDGTNSGYSDNLQTNGYIKSAQGKTVNNVRLTYTDNCVYNLTNAEICVSFSWSGTRDGEYEPYDAHTYPLDNDLVLRGIPKLDANNKLYYDGDTYAADGTVTRRYIEYTFTGNETWSLAATNSTGVYAINIILPTSPKNIGYDVISPIVCAEYAAETINRVYTKNVGISVNDAKTGVKFYDPNIQTVDAAKAKMIGKSIVYELATPTTETADPFASPQIVDDWGTEEYVITEQSGVAMPVGHVTKYPQNLRDKLQHLPNLASADGDYIVRQSGTQMSLVAKTNELPSAPTEDGTYSLKCTVSDGTASYSWVADA